MTQSKNIRLPGLNCGLCGYRTCNEFQERLVTSPEMLHRCIHLKQSGLHSGASTASAGKGTTNHFSESPSLAACQVAVPEEAASRPNVPAATSSRNIGTACQGCSVAPLATACGSQMTDLTNLPHDQQQPAWRDHLGREFDFFLEHFPEEPGPREIIVPHNPLLTRELDVQRGDVLIGRPLGMSCGCPITHCGVVMEVDPRTGLIVWCVTGPLGPRQKGYKDLGYYIAEAYEGLVQESRSELKLGMRYFFQPRMCMLQWRHSGLLNYLNRNAEGYQIRIEGLWIG